MKKVVSISNEGGSIAFLDTLNEFEGGKMILYTANAWVRYNNADSGSQDTIKIRSKRGINK